MIVTEIRWRAWLSAFFLAMTLVLATGALAGPYSPIDFQDPWQAALDGRMSSQWTAYMAHWDDRDGLPSWSSEPVEGSTGTSSGLVFEQIVQTSKWSQLPDLTKAGIDVKATKYLVLADDFLCRTRTKVTDITVWGSWLNDVLPQGDAGQVSFKLSIHGDIADPDGQGPAYSRPGAVLWTRSFAPGQFTLTQQASRLTEGWWDPSVPTSYIPEGDTICWRYDFDIPTLDAFCQEGSEQNPIVYWLAVQADVQTPTSDCVLPDNGSGTADLPPVGCAYSTPDDDMRIIDGLPPGTTVEIDATHRDFVCSAVDGVCSFPVGSNCRQAGGSLGGEMECFESHLTMPMVGTGTLAGFNRMITLPVSFETHVGPRTPYAPVQSFDTDMYRLFGQVTGDPDFDLLRVVAGTDFGMPSPGHTTLTHTPSGGWSVDSFFDITYRIDFIGAPGGPLNGLSGSTTGTVRFQIGSATTPQFGWKTSSSEHWNDDAVWGLGCIAPDNGSGTASLPPPCSYDDLGESMKIIDGLPAGDTVEIDTELGEYSGQSEVSGGSLGGKVQTFNAVMPFDMTGTGSLTGFSRDVNMPVACETRSAPRTPGDPVQTFATDMFRIQGQLPPGDPDFDLLRITAGTSFGLPSPGHTTLTHASDGNWSVDSFFDITYRIDFVGRPGGHFTGQSGSTTGTIRMQIGPWNEMRYPPSHTMSQQSIDLAFEIDGDQTCDEFDWADAPDGPTAPGYPTLAVNTGANHLIVSGMMLGSLIDAEADGQPNSTATGDDIADLDDEDGVVFNTPMAQGPTAMVSVTASIAGKLDAWVDFNIDGDWADSDEQIFAGEPLAAGVNVLTFSVPEKAAQGISYARFRFSSGGGLPYIGPASDGEVEDYQVKIYKPVNKGRAKLLPVGSYVLIEKDVVTANFGSLGWYFEEPARRGLTPDERGRSAGIGVLPGQGGPATWSIGQVVSAYGQTVLNGCELMLLEEGSWQESDQSSVFPVMQINRDSGGGLFGSQPGLINEVAISPDPDKPAFGLNSVGLLVTLVGRCNCVVVDPTGVNFWIDDGSALSDGSHCAGVKVRLPAGYSGPPIETENYYVVTGIMRTGSSPAEGECVRWLWPRTDTDILKLP